MARWHALLILLSLSVALCVNLKKKVRICGGFFGYLGVEFTVKVSKLDCLGAEYFFWMFGCLGAEYLSAEYFFLCFNNQY